ncbi:MAG TPA: hypothetical protein VL651_10675 [Bacteroidia bacterium]|nr:hypothetical protein [Bacteroidia bacterium]
MSKKAFVVLLPFFVLSCGNPVEKPPVSADSQKKVSSVDSIPPDDPNEDDGYEFLDNLTCEDLNDWGTLQNILKEDPEYSSLSFSESSEHFTIQRDFLGNGKTQTLVFIEAYGASSSGGCSNYISLFSCDSMARLILSDISGSFTESDIRDLDNDGVPEIISTCSILHMGECHDRYEIFNFKNGKRNFLYQSDAYSYIGCGFDDNVSWLKKGDSIGEDIHDSLVDPDGDHVWEIRSIRSKKIYAGGKLDKDIISNEIKQTDTFLIPLKEIH